MTERIDKNRRTDEKNCSKETRSGNNDRKTDSQLTYPLTDLSTNRYTPVSVDTREAIGVHLSEGSTIPSLYSSACRRRVLLPLSTFVVFVVTDR